MRDDDLAEAEAEARLAVAPRVPGDIARFTSNELFGEPGIYPDGSLMAPANGPPHDAAALRDVMELLSPTCAAPVLELWRAGRTPLARLRYGEPTSPGRIVGPDAAGARVVNRRYAGEDPRLVLPSLVHASLWSGPGAGHAEETVVHALGAYVHAELLADDPRLADLGTELCRRQNSVTISLLNSRRPGSATITLVAPDGPGTVPGGAPSMQTPDFWSIPFASRADDGAPIAPEVRGVLAAIAGVSVAEVPSRFTDELGDWCADAFAKILDPTTQLDANRALGLLS